ncbi:hypothetical protein ARAF_2009 [Arsenophonus endosymbiont of Aleurodicus floccissimus]|nr:hypothetical protein ARAF_2009 [Arsenophonus endosymbiont of Aleurodicus floccissimus]
MSRFLRDMIAISSESCDEKKVIHRIKQEMEKVGFDKIDIDPMGNYSGLYWPWISFNCHGCAH